MTIIFTEKTPLPWLQPVSLKRSTWADHILVSHPEMTGNLEKIKSVVRAPTRVVTGSSGDDRYIFIDDRETKGKRQAVLIAVVDVLTAEIVTAPYRVDYTGSRKGDKVWP